MVVQIQPNFPCENCIKCGKRPQVEQRKQVWTITCPDKNCKNLVKGKIADFVTWNRLNKKTADLVAAQSLETLKRTA